MRLCLISDGTVAGTYVADRDSGQRVPDVTSFRFEQTDYGETRLEVGVRIFREDDPESIVPMIAEPQPVELAEPRPRRCLS